MHSTHLLRCGLLLAALAATACSSTDDDDDASSSSGGSGSSSSGATSSSSSSSSGTAPSLDEIAGVSIPIDLALCGNLVPGVSSADIEFSWSGASAETTQYALRLAKIATPNKDDLSSYTTMVERLQSEPKILVGEKASGTTYRLDVYALNERTPVCVLGGFNSVDAP